MQKKLLFIFLILFSSNLLKAQIFDIDELNVLFNIPVKILDKKINLKKWYKVDELKGEDQTPYLINYRYISTDGKISANKIKMVEYKKGPPKILVFMTADPKTIIALDNKMLKTKYRLVEINNNNGTVNNLYLNGKLLYIFSKDVSTSVFLITTSKEYLEEKKVKN